ncbi:long-chain acyl-CoA synthetase [Planifilum fulgidum]|jgi:long-chain acyl-CoA synthetase|uniref:Long-chain acyl-CoA synthetase n=1 Tax=Planifilum fulgidum TaxID=201973 RepID=A0A1I2RIS5_9BACL|nr:long-chain fatty acid--CoA ligase [Planifilum fulgidum]MBO2497623.1 long-chain fatty acid--CoA ligase [Bacillota bacterium]MBO2532697.1 long-chain fatty acid--CoA ligase [Thermoactinomycetaceae bacterium]SFG40555.1 long-chain acyl-CoA synthetase [Planifilum fulgidum]
MWQKPQNLLEMLHFTVKRHPGKQAVLWKEEGRCRSLDYFELWDQIRQLAFALRQMGVQRNTKVAIVAENGPRWLISDFAILSLGAVTVPIHPSLNGNQIRAILQDADAEVAIVQNREMAERVKNWPERVKKVILMEASASDHPLMIPFNTAMDQGKACPIIDRWGWQSLGRNDLATIVYTSGTTGDPRGVMLSHGNILADVENLRHFVPVTHRDTSLSFLPLSHIFGRTAGLFLPAAAGGTVAYGDAPDTALENLLEIRPTLLIGVPRLFEKWHARVMESVERSSPLKKRLFRRALGVGEERLRHISQAPGRPLPLALEKKYLRARKLVFSGIHENAGGNLRLMISAGAPLHPEISRFFLAAGLPLVEGYGMAESPVIACNPVHLIKPGTAGRPIPGTEVKLTDDGELLVKGPGVMTGYHKRPEETAKTVVNGWLHTGDIAQIDGEGYLRIVDRKKNLIALSTGKHVAPQPVESALTASRFIEQAVLVGHNRPFVCALVVPEFDALARHAKKRGWPFQSREELARLSRRLLKGEIERLTAEFAPFERPRKFLVLTEPFTLEKGELTPSLKVRTGVAEKKYGEAIDALYSEEGWEEVISQSGGEAEPPTPSEGPAVVPLFQPEESEASDSPKKSLRWKEVILSRQVFVGILIGVLAGIIARVLF